MLQAWSACPPCCGIDAMRLTNRLKISDAERDQFIEKTVEVVIFAPSRNNGKRQQKKLATRGHGSH